MSDPSATARVRLGNTQTARVTLSRAVPTPHSATFDAPANPTVDINQTFDATGKTNVRVSITGPGLYGMTRGGQLIGKGGGGGGFAFKNFGTPGAVVYRMVTGEDDMTGATVFARVTNEAGSVTYAQAAGGFAGEDGGYGGGSALALAAGGSTQTGDITHAGGGGGAGYTNTYYGGGGGGGQAATISGNGADGASSTDQTGHASSAGGGMAGAAGSGGASGSKAHPAGFAGTAPGGGGGGGTFFADPFTQGGGGDGTPARFVWTWN